VLLFIDNWKNYFTDSLICHFDIFLPQTILRLKSNDKIVFED